MSKNSLAIPLLTLALTATAPTSASGPASPGRPPSPEAGEDEGDQTLHGIYTSGFQRGPQRLRAVFSPDGEESWKLRVHFRFSGEDRVYRGLARGNLVEGILNARVHDETGQRVFTFRCEFDRKRRCKGTHAEVVRTGEQETGTITLNARRR